MIYGFLNEGSGAGNQLHRYIATRIKALQLNTDWRMIWQPDGSGKGFGFKCKDFMQFDMDKVVYDYPILNFWNEKKVVENGVDIRSYDPEWNFIEDDTLVEGELQDECYWQEYEKEVNEWLKVEYLDIPDDVCVIGFRGGEFAVFPDLFLTKDYWDKAIAKMREINPHMRFEIHTDDKLLAMSFFNGDLKEDFPVIHDIGINWRSMRYARYAIIANSSFFILPRWLNGYTTIAPRYWARRNTKTWALPSNYYSRFQYI